MNRRTDRETFAARAGLVPLSGGHKRADKGREGSFCIPCAVSHPDFRERAPLTHSVPFDEGQPPRAWIGGRSYSLLPQLGTTASCMCCGEKAWAVYCPEGDQTS
jgi:hypothetical protein